MICKECKAEINTNKPIVTKTFKYYYRCPECDTMYVVHLKNSLPYIIIVGVTFIVSRILFNGDDWTSYLIAFVLSAVAVMIHNVIIYYKREWLLEKGYLKLEEAFVWPDVD